jgi:UDP-N-acetylglucosamine 2-epimerase
MLIATVVGVRPQFIKAAAISRVLRSDCYRHVKEKLIHTGQHYDYRMSDVFFDELGIPTPAVNLRIGSDLQGAQTAAMLAAIEGTLIELGPDIVLAYGDTNSTLAAGLAAAKLGIPFVHAESGERFFRRRNVPEEVNRVVSDAVASLCLTFTERGRFQLLREGICPDRIKFVGDPMYDIFLWGRERALARTSEKLSEVGVEPGEYYLSTIHRVENSSDIDRFIGLIEVLDSLDRPSVLPLHPRIADKLKEVGWRGSGNLKLIEAQSYTDFQCLLLNCRKCLTDSGGVMRETFFAGKPGIVPMINTWWPEIVESGWAFEAGRDLSVLRQALLEFKAPASYPNGLFGNGDAAERIVEAVTGFKVGPDGEAAWHWQGTVSQLPPNVYSGLTFGAYASMLAELRQMGYESAPTATNSYSLLLRHDIVLDLESALPLAQIESDAGMSSTYFLDPTSSLYNVSAPEAASALARLRQLKHRVGLLVTAADKSIVERSARLLELAAGTPVEWVAVANGRTMQRGDPRPVDGVVVSVRDAHWEPAPPLQVADREKRRGLTISTDPVWWANRAKPPQQRLAELALDRFAATERNIARLSSSVRFGTLADASEDAQAVERSGTVRRAAERVPS